MVRNVHQRLGDMQSSLVEMKRGLHFWDGVYREIGRVETSIERIRKEPAPDITEVDEFRRQRDELYNKVLKELHDNIENEEKYVLPALIGTAGVGLAVPAVFFSVKLGVLAGALLALRRVGALARKIPWKSLKEIPKQTGSKWNWVKSKWNWVREKWYRRWAPVPLGASFGLGRTLYVSRKLVAQSEAQKKMAPEQLRAQLKTNPPSLAQGLEWVEEYSGDPLFIKEILPKLYSQVTTPEGILVLTHALLETFSLSASLQSATKMEYGVLLEEGSEHSLERFRKWMITLDRSGALSSEESLIGIDFDQDGSVDETIAGHFVRGGMNDFQEKLEREKESVLELMTIHEKWISLQPGIAADFKSYIPQRKIWIDKTFSLTWGDSQSKIRDLPLYIGKSARAFLEMKEDFKAKNQNIWDLYFANAGNFWGSMGGMAGFLVTPFFLEGGLSLMIKSIPFMMAGSWVEASYTAEKNALLRQPVTLCVPGFGSLCEEL